MEGVHDSRDNNFLQIWTTIQNIPKFIRPFPQYIILTQKTKRYMITYIEKKGKSKMKYLQIKQLKDHYSLQQKYQEHLQKQHLPHSPPQALPCKCEDQIIIIKKKNKWGKPIYIIHMIAWFQESGTWNYKPILEIQKIKHIELSLKPFTMQ